MAKIAAAVDIGTNSVKITVAKRAEDGYYLDILADRTVITRLGKNVDAEGRLAPSAVQKTLDALADFAKEARSLGAETIAAVGTSALRDAANGPEFVTKATHILGGTVEVISGDREAQLVWAAASRDPQLQDVIAGLYPYQLDKVTLIATDSGGGSTEVIIGTKDNVTFRTSLQLGAVRLTERTKPSDPYTAADLARATAICDEAIKAVPVPTAPSVVIASGGTAANLGAMETGIEDELHGYELWPETITEQVARLAALPLAERRKVPGLEPDRADVIVSGALIQSRLLAHLKTPYLLVSLRGVRYGLLYTLL